MAVCRENKEVLKPLTLIATKAVVREAMAKAAVKVCVRTVASDIAKEGTKEALKVGAKQAAKQGTKAVATGLVKAANPVGIVADIAQASLEHMGMEEVGKKVGMTGNIAAGAMLGSVGGPPGAAVGALGGFLVWGVGEAVGRVIDRAFV